MNKSPYINQINFLPHAAARNEPVGDSIALDHETPPAHGGNVHAFAREFGVRVRDVLDFSANINPLGFPAGIRRAVLESLDLLGHYPDPDSVDLRAALASYHGVPKSRVMVGNGSTELIYLVARGLRPKGALVTVPAFSEYERALVLAEAPTDFFITSEQNGFTLRHAPGAAGFDLIFMANPASPCGTLLDPEELVPIVSELERRGITVVLDEAFIDFVEEASFKGFLGRFKNVILLRSFTKFFGIPGIRLGYLLASEDLIARLSVYREPWSVSTPAQAIGLECLRDRRFIEESRAVVAEERAWLSARLEEIGGLKVFPGSANYLLIKFTEPGWTAALARKRLAARAILVRDASNFRGLDQRFIRVAVKLRADNERLVAALASMAEKD